MQTSILIIDDDEDDYLLLREAIMELRAQTIIYAATDGEYALELLEELKDHLPSLIILDLKLPKLDGMEVLARIKSNYSIPVLVYTTTLSDKVIAQAKSYGVLDCVTKVASFSEAQALLKRFL